ncbi:MAG: hypothetical protein AAF797_16805 [Planctomycetota bacterium]
MKLETLAYQIAERSADQLERARDAQPEDRNHELAVGRELRMLVGALAAGLGASPEEQEGR